MSRVLILCRSDIKYVQSDLALSLHLNEMLPHSDSWAHYIINKSAVIGSMCTCLLYLLTMTSLLRHETMNAGMIYVSRLASRQTFKSGEVYPDYSTEGKLSTGV